MICKLISYDIDLRFNVLREFAGANVSFGYLRNLEFRTKKAKEVVKGKKRRRSVASRS